MASVTKTPITKESLIEYGFDKGYSKLYYSIGNNWYIECEESLPVGGLWRVSITAYMDDETEFILDYQYIEQIDNLVKALKGEL